MKILMAILLMVASQAMALDADDLSSAVGYFVLASSSVTASGDTDDGDTFVKVRGYGEFILEGVHLPPLELSSVVVLAKQMKVADKTFTFYKLVIDDEIMDAHKPR